MGSMSGESLGVLRSFIAGANAQYRAAGLGEYQLRVKSDGTVDVPDRPAPSFPAPDAAGSAAREQATAGAAAQTGAPPTASAAPPAGAATAAPAGAAPKITGLQQSGADAFRLAWAPVQGAVRYGVWQDGVLIGSVPKPEYAASLAVGASGTIQIDAELAGGKRSAKTPALVASRGADGKLAFDVPGATKPAAGAAPPATPAPAAAPAATTPSSASTPASGAPTAGAAPAPAAPPAGAATASAAPAG